MEYRDKSPSEMSHHQFLAAKTAGFIGQNFLCFRTIIIRHSQATTRNIGSFMDPGGKLDAGKETLKVWGWNLEALARTEERCSISGWRNYRWPSQGWELRWLFSLQSFPALPHAQWRPAGNCVGAREVGWGFVGSNTNYCEKLQKIRHTHTFWGQRVPVVTSSKLREEAVKDLFQNMNSLVCWQPAEATCGHQKDLLKIRVFLSNF